MESNTFRMTPPVPIIARQLSHDTQIGAVTLPEGMTVIVSPVSASRDARVGRPFFFQFIARLV